MLFPLHVMPSHFKPSPHGYCVCLVAARSVALTSGKWLRQAACLLLWYILYPEGQLPIQTHPADCGKPAFNMQNESTLKPAAWVKLSGCHSACRSSTVQKMVYWTWGRRQINLGTQSTLHFNTCNLFPLQGPYSISLWAICRNCLEEETMFRNSFLWF